MRTLQRHVILSSILLSILTPFALAQKVNTASAPHIGYIYPAGGQQGATFEIAIGGQYLTGGNEIRVTGGGVSAKVLKLEVGLTAKQANELKDKVKALMERRAASPNGTLSTEDQKLLAEIRKQLKKGKALSPFLAETATLQVAIDAKAAVGPRELRMVTPSGLSNPLTFCVGQLTEFSEPASKSIDSDAPMSITLPAVVNGQIMPGGVNRYRFKAHRGDRLVFAVSARELVPYIADAVPGWFQAALGIYDSAGNELAYADHYQFHPDPVIYHEFAADGDCTMEIKDSIYRGREDFVYRITVGQLPFVTAIFPLGAKVGAPAAVGLQGWNLPTTHLTPSASAAGPSSFCVHNGILDSNMAAFAVDTLPECGERKPNDSIASAQPVTLPIIVNGRIDHPGAAGVFSFEGHAGEIVVAEVYARRLNSPLDSIVKLTDAAGKQLAINDDHDDKAAGLLTHQADSWLRATLPASGTYCLHIGDAQHKGGPEYSYRLRISHPRPDFELRVTPSSINVRAGGTAPITVYAIRRDGFSREIVLDLSHAPSGCTLVGAKIPAGEDMVKATLSVPATDVGGPFNIQLVGRASIEGRMVVRPAIPAEEMTQAFFYKHLVPTSEWLLDVSDRRAARADFKVASAMPVRIPSGGRTHIDVMVSKSVFLGEVEFDLADPPDGLTIVKTTAGAAGSEIVLEADAAKLKPGLKGNLIINAFGHRAGQLNKPTKAKGRQRIPLGTLPAVPFEVVGR